MFSTKTPSSLAEAKAPLVLLLFPADLSSRPFGAIYYSALLPTPYFCISEVFCEFISLETALYCF